MNERIVFDGGEENDDESVTGHKSEAEDEGGPLDRKRMFWEERFATPHRKDTAEDVGDEEEAIEEEVVPTFEDIESGEPFETSLPDDFRHDLIEEYRRRQRAQIEEDDEESESEEDESPETDGGTNTPPEIPSPPPANNWIPIGPSVVRQGQGGTRPPVGGRTPGIAVAPGGTRVYAATANGGVWRSTNTGRTWRSLMDAFDLNPTHQASDSLACGAIALVAGPTASKDRIYVGSGEGHGGAYFGVGPIVSTDGGTTWNTEPIAPGSPSLGGTGFYALTIDPADPNRAVAATRRGVYRREPDGSGGFHWNRKTVGGITGHAATSVVAARRGATTTFYAALHNDQVYASTDGDAWTRIGNGFPTGSMRIALAVQPTNPDVIYSLSETGRVHRLDVNDGTWRGITGVPAPTDLVRQQGWYDLAIAIAPDNVNRIYLGGATVPSGGDWSGALYRCAIAISGTTVSATSTYIGNAVHADIHTIVFAPGDATKLWVGCDGGVFYSTNPTGTGDLFVPRNTGLATMTMNHLDQHPTEDAVVFAGTQDNGGERFTGEEAWIYSSGGDSGYFVVNWNDPYRILDTYVRNVVRRSTNGGGRYSYAYVDVPIDSNERVLFYAPLVGTPRNPSDTSEANVVAFGSERPWISTTFGGNWRSIPNGTLAEDRLNERIRSLAFASATRLYVGTLAGGVYRFDRSGTTWTRTRIDTMGGLPSNFALPVTDIAVDRNDSTRDSIYITFGGLGDYRRVWHFDGSQWRQRSGPSAGHINSLLNVQHNAIIVDPANPSHVYVGADIGVWRSIDGGTNWEPFSHGLPDAAVMDLKIHEERRLLRASTHGRSVYERTLDDAPKQGVELYIRDTQLDQGRRWTINGLPDPTKQGDTVRHWEGPDIKLDTPDTTGQYQLPLAGNIDFLQFVDELTDDYRNVATHATATITSRVYVQVHNRGVMPANNVRVMLLLTNASAGLAPLPADYDENVRNGTPISDANWRTVGITTLNGIRPGVPKIAAFNLTSNLLPPPANLAGNDHHCVLALVHHPDDEYTSTERNADVNSRQERKATHKNLHVVQFIGTVPNPPPVAIPVRINAASFEEHTFNRVVASLNGYPGRVRLFIPPLEFDENIEDSIEGVVIDDDFEEFKAWANEQLELIERTQASEHPYDTEWVEQRIMDIERALESGFMLTADNEETFHLDRIVMEPESHHTFFVLLDRPEDGEPGEWFDIEFLHESAESEELIGGLSTRVELVTEPERETYVLEFWRDEWKERHAVLRAVLYGVTGNRISPEDNGSIELVIRDGGTEEEATMRWHRGWESFYYFLPRSTSSTTVIASGRINGTEVATAYL